MLRMIRATLLYDSIVLRLDNELDRYDEYTLFMKDRAQLVKKKWRKKLRDNSGDQFFLNLEDLGKSLTDLMISAQTTLNRPIVSFGSTVDKWVFSIAVLSRMVGRILLVTFLAMGAIALYNSLTGQVKSFQDILGSVLQSSFTGYSCSAHVF